MLSFLLLTFSLFLSLFPYFSYFSYFSYSSYSSLSSLSSLSLSPSSPLLLSAPLYTHNLLLSSSPPLLLSSSPSSPSLLLSSFQIEICLLGVRPNVAEDSSPLPELIELFNPQNKKNKKKISDCIVLYKIPVRHYGDKLDPSETASVVHNNLVRRLSHVHKTTGLSLRQMEHLLAQRMSRLVIF